MNKPKILTKAKNGSKTKRVLNYFLKNPELKFKNSREALTHFEEKTKTRVDFSSFKKMIFFYNEGLYSVNDTTSKEQKIDFTKKSNNNIKNKADLLEKTKGDSDYTKEVHDSVISNVDADSFQKPEIGDWVELCRKHGVDDKIAKMFWDKSSNEYSICYLNPIPPQIRNISIDTALQNIVDTINTGVKKKSWKPNKKKSQKGLNVVISDAHVGMDIADGGLFSYEYGAEDYTKNMRGVFDNIVKEYNTHGHFDMIVINNLGDQEDGWGGNTTRGGHGLPQNMTETEVFKVCVEAHLDMIENVLNQGITNKVILRSCINSNHSASFGEIVATAVKMIVQKIYKNDVVEVDILTKFMEHRIFGDHIFILTHGKDKDQMFKGLPLNLNDKTVNYINDYIRHYELDRGKHIHVHKGDLHQLGFEKTVNFDYNNFGSFAPPSSWVQHNFGDSYSCYTIQVIEKYSNDISTSNYFLNYKRSNLK